MSKHLVIAAICAASAALASCATTPPPTPEEIASYDYGPVPSQEQFRRVVESHIASLMRDPESARFTHGHFRRGYWQEFLGGRHWGYIGCGTVNAKNGFGGYAGASAFVSVYHKGRVIFADVDSEAGGIVQMQCSQGGFNVR